MKKILIAAPSSGSGKTLLATALLAALRRRGFHPAAMKCGPDFIDPMFHRTVLGIDGANLDRFFLSPTELRRHFARTTRSLSADIAVIEGVMGYYDGMEMDNVIGSSYDIGQILGAPAILVVDARGMAASAAALIRGFQEYRTPDGIRGVILNRVSGGTARMLAPLIRKECRIPVVGSFPAREDLHIDSRHLGLVLPGEMPEIGNILSRAADQLEETVDLDLLLQIAGEEEDFSLPEEDPAWPIVTERKCRIAVSRDRAFCFLYEENLRLLRELGAEIVFFSPLYDRTLPEGIGGMILAGGYPENYADIFEKNASMRESIRGSIRSGMPYLAECGGFLALHEELEAADGTIHGGAGIFPGRAYRKGRSRRFGYIELTAPDGLKIRAHEYHYWESPDPGGDWHAEKPDGRSWDAMHDNSAGQIAGFPHLYYLSCPEFLRKWIGFCSNFCKNS